MKAGKILITLIILSVFGTGIFLVINQSKSNQSNDTTQKSIAKEVMNTAMKLKSASFNDQMDIPEKYTCDGENISPPLVFSEVPAEAKSLVLIVDDPDAPSGDWVHWLVWNINPKIKEVSEGDIPGGSTQGLNDFGNYDYGGPCPPSGKHKYQFKLYALDIVLDLAADTKKQELVGAIENHILDQALLVGFYQKK